MENQSWEERFLEEYYELKRRTRKLRNVVVKMEAAERCYKDLKTFLDFDPKCPLSILDEQLYTMERYLRILEQRAAIEGIEINVL